MQIWGSNMNFNVQLLSTLCASLQAYIPHVSRCDSNIWTLKVQTIDFRKNQPYYLNGSVSMHPGGSLEIFSDWSFTSMFQMQVSLFTKGLALCYPPRSCCPIAKDISLHTWARLYVLCARIIWPSLPPLGTCADIFNTYLNDSWILDKTWPL